MPLDVLLSLIGIAVAAAWTPGPNNALVASSGARFGIRRTIPHIIGIGVGFPIMIFCVAIGLGQIFQQSAVLREIIRYGGIVLLLFVAWNIARAGDPTKNGKNTRPFSFVQAAAFQWVNPKAWVMAIGISAQYVSSDAPVFTALIVSTVFLVVGFGSASSWAMFGAVMQHWLGSNNRLRIFNFTMAALIVLSVFIIFFAELA